MKEKGLLLDTHAILWLLADVYLGKHTKDLIRKSNAVYFSLVSLWELSIKSNLGKIELTENFEESLLESGLFELSIKVEHLRFLRTYNFEKNHKLLTKLKKNKDPFDQMLVVQANMENLKFVTADKTLLGMDATFVDASN